MRSRTFLSLGVIEFINRKDPALLNRNSVDEKNGKSSMSLRNLSLACTCT